MNLLPESPSFYRKESSYVSFGDELVLSNRGQRELLRGIMTKGKPLRTRVRGISMSPCIRDQDIVTIEPLDVRQLRVGAIVAFVLPGKDERLTIHRIIAKHETGWLIRGDNSPIGDGIITCDSILGQITRVERHGKTMRFGLGLEGLLIAVFNRGETLMRLRKLGRLPHFTAGLVLRWVQSVSVYRALVKRFLSPVTISSAEENDMEAVLLHLNPSVGAYAPTVDPNITNLVAKKGKKIIGFVQLVYHPEDHFPWIGYWLFSLTVWPWYRGQGIGEALTIGVIEEARKRGAKELLLVVNDNNKRAIRLYHKLGFEYLTLPSLEPGFEAEKSQYGWRRIVLRKHLSGP